jgi:hypothetical protein
MSCATGSHDPWYLRWLNIAFRTFHLIVSGLLLGGHMFDVASERLLVFLILTIVSGATLVALELLRSWRWTYQGMGLAVELKLGLLMVAAAWPSQRVPLLIVAVILGSVGSHMPGRFRHFSLIDGRVLSDEPRSSGHEDPS